MIFSIFQVSGDRERWSTAFVRHFTLCGIQLERLFSCNSKSIIAAHVRDHSTTIVSCTNLTGFALMLVVTYSETESV